MNYIKSNKECNCVPFVLKYCRGQPNTIQIKKRQIIIENSDRLKSAFQNTPIVAFMRYKNINHIVHKKHGNIFFKNENLFMS